MGDILEMCDMKLEFLQNFFANKLGSRGFNLGGWGGRRRGKEDKVATEVDST